MTSNFTGTNLIFLISQPRAGSTMLQKILGSHPDIYTVSEPWLLLHPFYALKDQGYQAEYNADLFRQGFKTFLNLFPEKEQIYLKTIAEVYSKLYDKALLKTEKKFFLDKTPRYYNIIPELASTFPEAKFIILFRNPLAVISSIISTWVIPSDTRWFYLRNYKNDLIKAPELLLEGLDCLQDKCFLISYEQLLENPREQLESLCKKLNLDFDIRILENSQNNSANWHFGDKKNPYKTSQPNINNIESWKKSLNSPQTWRIVKEYLNFLGPITIKRMGYSYENMFEYLSQYSRYYAPFWLSTLSLEDILNIPDNYFLRKYKHYKIKMINKLEKKEIWRIFSTLPEKIK